MKALRISEKYQTCPDATYAIKAKDDPLYSSNGDAIKCQDKAYGPSICNERAHRDYNWVSEP